MAARSRFIKGSGPLSKSKRHFERWLVQQGYEACSEMYPAAVWASALVGEYLRDYPEHETDKSAVEKHAEDIGWISTYVDEEDTNDSDQ